jgi:hypothetical protein
LNIRLAGHMVEGIRRGQNGRAFQFLETQISYNLDFLTKLSEILSLNTDDRDLMFESTTS